MEQNKMNSTNQPDFPVNSIPPITKNAVLEAQTNIKAPLVLIFSSAMSAISLACQSFINVRRPNGLVGPVSTYFITVGESNERKTATDKEFKKPICEFEVRQTEKEKLHLVKYEANQLAWDIERKEILQALKKAAKKEQPDDKLILRLADHISKKPRKPRATKLIYNDATPEAIKFGLHENGPSAGLISNEAGSILNGNAMADLGFLNSIWGGDSFHVDRRSSDSFSVRDPRLTISLMIQPELFKKYLNRRGAEARGIGLFARFFMSFPRSTQGERFIQNHVPSWQHLPIFQDRATTILNQAPAMITLEFTPEAQVRWVDAYNSVEFDINPGRYLWDVKDFAGKFSENVARIAALFHYFEGMQGDISLETTNRAIDICAWYMHEFKRLFSEEGAISVEQSDANQLEHWLANYVWNNGFKEIKKNHIRQYIPRSALRSKARLDPALNHLKFQGRIAFFEKKDGTYVDLNPHYFGNRVSFVS
jgi:hypothetical protein